MPNCQEQDSQAGKLRRRECLAALLSAIALGACQTRPAAPAVAAPAGPGPATPAPPPAPAPAPAPPVSPRARRLPRLALALGGGAARGFAHIGVFQALEEAGVRPDIVVGTSAGSLVAALVAHGKSGAELANLALTMDESAITDWAYPGRGMIRGEALARYVREHTGGLLIEQMKLRLGVVATDLDTGTAALFERGDTGLAVRASSAVPAVFQPVRINGREYVDGGFVSPVPVRFARQMGAEMVIAVDISTPPDGNNTGDTLKLLLQTFAIMGKSLNAFELRDADVVVRPALVGVAGADFTSRVRAMRAGREITAALLPEIRSKLQALSR